MGSIGVRLSNVNSVTERIPSANRASQSESGDAVRRKKLVQIRAGPSGRHGLCWCSKTGDGVPSDQRGTGIYSTVGSKTLPSPPKIGESFSPAPQAMA
jgi:hypothetical protein